MDLKNNYWTKNPATLAAFFDEKEIALIVAQIQSIRRIDCVVFCSFENRFAKSGGLAAVTTKILPFLKQRDNIPNVILLTPFYPNIIPEERLESTRLTIKVPFDDNSYKVEILKYVQNYEHPASGKIEEFYLKTDGFFGAKNGLNDPYIYDEHGRQNDAALRENSLFFCQAAPLALQKLGFKKNIILHLQDWETVLIALTAKTAILNGTLESCATLCTLHNPFDSGWLSFNSLAKILEGKKRTKLSHNFQDNLTAHQIGLSLVDGTITTVSKNFARELKRDILHTGHFASHLQNIFEKNKIKGINNGMFVDFPPEFSEFANQDRQRLAKQKSVASGK